MNSFDDLPTRDNTHDIAEAAETAFLSAVNSCEMFVVQGKDRNDYGTDIQIEARNGNAMSNIRAHVQLKGTKSEAKKDGSISVSVARTNLNYLIANPGSMYVCYHLPSNSLLVRYAEDVLREYEHRGDDWKRQETVTVSFRDTFDSEFQRAFNAWLLANARTFRDRRLRWSVTPPEKLSTLVQWESTIIDVPVNPEQAEAILTELYRKGSDAVISGAFTQFSAVLHSVPGAIDLAYMAEINLGLNEHEFDRERVQQGISVLKERIEKGDIHLGTLLYSIGNAWFALGEYEKARNTYNAALFKLDNPELSGVAAQCCKNMGSLLEKLSNTEAARVFYERSLVLNPDLGEAHLAISHLYRRNGDYKSALEHLDQVIHQGGSALQISAVQGWMVDLLFKMEDYNAAFREINNLISLAGQAEWIGPWCANLVSQFGKVSAEVAKKSLRFWRTYLCKHPNDTAAKRERLLCMWLVHTNGSVTETSYKDFKIAVVQQIESGDPDPAYLWDRLGHWAQYDEDWIEAESAYRSAYELEPSRHGYCLGTALNFLKRYSEALPILLTASEKYQPDAMSWFQVAVAREGVGDINGCISAYQRALDLDPAYDLAWFNIGGVYLNSGDIPHAMETWREAVSRFPDHKLALKLRSEFPFIFK